MPKNQKSKFHLKQWFLYEEPKKIYKMKIILIITMQIRIFFIFKRSEKVTLGISGVSKIIKTQVITKKKLRIKVVFLHMLIYVLIKSFVYKSIFLFLFLIIFFHYTRL